MTGRRRREVPAQLNRSARARHPEQALPDALQYLLQAPVGQTQMPMQVIQSKQSLLALKHICCNFWGRWASTGSLL